MLFNHRNAGALLIWALLPLAGIHSGGTMAATVSVIETGAAGTNNPATSSWDVVTVGAGTLEITLLHADKSEWFEWSLSGSGSGSGQFTPDPSNYLGTWSNGNPGGQYFFTATNYPSVGPTAPPEDFTVEFAFTPNVLGGDPTIDRLIVTPSAVPLPAAAWLFASAMLGLAAIGRRARQA
jgi:hypothetical protein